MKKLKIQKQLNPNRIILSRCVLSKKGSRLFVNTTTYNFSEGLVAFILILFRLTPTLSKRTLDSRVLNPF